jgi:uncharacterized BrkB/YihY/UPF0761 family membrane protein
MEPAQAGSTLPESCRSRNARSAPFVSPQVLELITEQMRRLANNENGGLLTFGVAGALWSSSAALVSIVGALNRAYDIDEGRPWWKVRLVAIGLTFARPTSSVTFERGKKLATASKNRMAGKSARKK